MIRMGNPSLGVSDEKLDSHLPFSTEKIASPVFAIP